MTAVNFSAQGTRWRVIPIAVETASREYVPRLPGTGLFFTSEDAETRFLPLAPDAVPTPEVLRRKPVEELARLVRSAQPLDR